LAWPLPLSVIELILRACQSGDGLQHSLSSSVQ
jgi:hypothetical protein